MNSVFILAQDVNVFNMGVYLNGSRCIPNWVITCTRFGFYETAIRELRYIIDTMLQAIYIDKIESDMDINTKVIIQETLERLGGFMSPKLAQKAGLKASTKKKIETFYSDLSRYVHGSQLELKTKVNNKRLR